MASLPDLYDQYAAFGVPSRYASRAPRGYYFVRQLLIAGAIAGGIVALYRNDVFRDLARRAGQERRYLAAEQFLVGSPGWGTPRSMEPVLNGTEPEPVATLSVPAAPPVLAAAPASQPPAQQPQPASAPAAPAPLAAAVTPVTLTAAAPAPVAPPAAPPAAATSDALVPIPFSALPRTANEKLTPVSIDSLPVAGSHARSTAAAAPPARASEPSRSTSTPVRTSKVALDEAPAPKAKAEPKRAEPKPEPKPEPEPKGPKTTDPHPHDNPLTAAIRGAVRARPPKE